MRQGNWKMIESLEAGRVQLYDLTRDVGEPNDVSATNPEVVDRLRLRLLQWRVESNAPMPRTQERRLQGIPPIPIVEWRQETSAE